MPRKASHGTEVQIETSKPSHSKQEEMAATLPSSQSVYHTRSNSLPSRPHPVSSELTEHLNRLRSSEATSSTSSSISQQLNGLQDLHDCVDKLLQLPSTQQAFIQEEHKIFVDEVLAGSLKLLDVCSSAKDALLHTKESLNEFQSVIRRKRGEITLGGEVKKFLASRKTVRKTNQKILKSLKDLEDKYAFKKVDETFPIISLFREVTAVTKTVFESLLYFMSGPKPQSKSSSNWLLLSKLMNSRRVACEEEANVNEFAVVDGALRSFGCKSEESIKIENVQSKLLNLDLCVEDLEGELECLFRCLIKARVSILNIYNH